jgi:hypothetical protein
MPQLCLALFLVAGAGPIPHYDRVPPVQLADLGRFPPRQVCDDRIWFLTEHLEWVVRHGSLYPHEVWFWYDYYHEVERMRTAWVLCEEAQRPLWHDSTRLQSLLQLRELLGLENYYRGVMPWWPTTTAGRSR